MRAIVSDTYGSEHVHELMDIEKPEVGGDHVLVRVRAAAANPYDLVLPVVLRSIGRVGARLRGPKVRFRVWIWPARSRLSART